MKKIIVIISVLFAVCAMPSCVKPYTNDISLGLNNYDLTLNKNIDKDEKKGVNGELLHYIQITATGPWEATLFPAKQGEIWCWLWNYHVTPQKDAEGNYIKGEDDLTILYNYSYIAEAVEYFEGSTTKLCKVRGKAGVTYLPLEYSTNSTSMRYATFHIKRLDTGEERVMYITQKS
jgi:hypothetical protein